MVKRSKTTRRGRGTRKASRTKRSRRYRGGQAAMPNAAPAGNAATASAAPPKSVKVYVTKTASGIDMSTGVKSSSSLVSVSSTGPNSVTLSVDPSLGPLREWSAQGFAASGWTAVAPAKLNRGGATVVVESAGKPVKARGAAPAAYSTLVVKGLDQGNFAAFKPGGNTANGGANICITLNFV